MYSAECAAFSMLPGMRQRTRLNGGWMGGGWSGDEEMGVGVVVVVPWWTVAKTDLKIRGS
jgi:hypothetical protein